MDKMNLDGQYQIYNGRGKESEVVKPENSKYGNFWIKGKPDFGLLENLKKKGMRRFIPLLPEHRTEPEETLGYSTNLATILIYANYETNFHEVNIILKVKGLEDQNAIEKTRLMLESKLKFELEDPTKSISSLIKDVGEN